MRTTFGIPAKGRILILFLLPLIQSAAQTASLSDYAVPRFILQVEHRTATFTTNLVMEIHYKNGTTETVSREHLNQKGNKHWEHQFSTSIKSIKFQGFLKSEDLFTPLKPIFHRVISIDSTWKSYKIEFGGSFRRPNASGHHEKNKA